MGIRVEGVDLGRMGGVTLRYSSTAPLRFKVNLRHPDGRRSWWRSGTMEAGRGLVADLPLRAFEDEAWGLWMPPGPFDRVEIFWEEPSGTVVLDEVALRPPAEGEAGPRLTAEEFLDLGFPGGGRSVRSKSFLLLSDQKEYLGPKGTRLLGDLEKGVASLAAFGLDTQVEERVPVLLFGGDGDLRDFTNRYHRFLGRKEWTVPGPVAACGIGPAALGARWKGKDLLVSAILHEALHPVVRSRIGLRANTWIQEGLVTAVQRRLQPEYFKAVAGSFRTVSAGLFRERLRGPVRGQLELRRLASLDDPPFEEFLELASIFEFLQARRRAALPDFWRAVRSLARPPWTPEALDLLCRALETTPEEFEQEWLAWGAENYR